MQFFKKGHEPLKWVAVLAALTGFTILSGCRSDNQTQAAESAGPAPLPQVAVVTVQPQQITLTTELPGRTSAYRVAEIRPQVNGIIQKRLFTEGADVKAGDVLYQIDPALYQATLDNAKASLCRAEANLPAVQSRADRYRELAVEKAVSQQDFDDAVAALKQAEADVQYCKASVETARINLAYTRITAPIPGRIGRSNITEGAIVTAYQPVALATIQQLDPIYVDVPQSTTELLRLKNSGLNQNETNQNTVKLILEGGSGYPQEGTLQFKDVTVDPTTGSVTLRAVFPNPDNVLLPGMFVQTVIQEGVNPAAILVPQQGVSRDRRGNPTALIVEADNKSALRMLTVDRAIGDQWLVSDGLAPGDRVIVEGLKMLRPGTKVKTVSFNSDSAISAIVAQPATRSN